MALCRQRLRELLPNLAKRLPPSLPGGGFDGYMHGPALSLEDLALAAPLVSPAHYCEGRFAFALAAAEASDAEYRRELEEWRQTDVGQYALWMYGRHRMRPLPEALRPAHALRARLGASECKRASTIPRGSGSEQRAGAVRIYIDKTQADWQVRRPPKAQSMSQNGMSLSPG